MSSQVKFSLLNAERNATETLLVHWAWALWSLFSRLSDCQALRVQRGSPEPWSPFPLPWPFWSPSHRLPTILTCKKKKKVVRRQEGPSLKTPTLYNYKGHCYRSNFNYSTLRFFSRKSYKQEDKFGLYFFPLSYLKHSFKLPRGMGYLSIDRVIIVDSKTRYAKVQGLNFLLHSVTYFKRAAVIGT